MDDASAMFDNLLQAGNLLPLAALIAVSLAGVIWIIALLKAERNVATVSLAIISLLAVGVAALLGLRGGGSSQAANETHAPVAVSQPALACLDEMAGETVLEACERSLFASPDTVAAAVSQSSERIRQLLSNGASEKVSPQFAALRRSVERDRYGFMAHVLSTTYNCTPDACIAFRSLNDRTKIAANMTAKTYDTRVAQHAAQWGAPSAATAALPGHTTPVPVPNVVELPPSVAGLPPSVPTGRPTDADFPSANSIPPVNIMTDTPVRTREAPTASPDSQPAQRKAQMPKPRPQPRAEPHGTGAPVQLAPAAPSR